MGNEVKLKEKYDFILPVLNEKQRRMLLVADAKFFGFGGITYVTKASGVTRATIHNGLNEINKPTADANINNDRIRKAGAGRKSIVKQYPAIMEDLDNLVSPVTRGDPMSPLRWCCKSLRNLSELLQAMEHKISYRVVGELLKESGYSLQANRKKEEGGNHPDRNEQFYHINETVKEHIAGYQPVISVYCKKKENIGNYKNSGKEWEHEGDPQKVKVNDFEDKELGKVSPFGVYNFKNNEGLVNVGISSDTA